jgi:hypothetical protein
MWLLGSPEMASTYLLAKRPRQYWKYHKNISGFFRAILLTLSAQH